MPSTGEGRLTDTPGPGDPIDPTADADDARLARLGLRVQAMQSVLVRLLQEVVQAEARRDEHRARQLLEANERLVEAALSSQQQAEVAEQALSHATHRASLDPLTQLPTRAVLVDRFEQAAAHARRHGSRFALLFLDLDHFKGLNDEHGHGFGDHVLRAVAQRLASAVRELDTVSRHGGDEFVILLAELGRRDDAQAVAEKLNAAVGAPLAVDGHTVGITASIGISVFPDDGEDLDTLVRRADGAMYATKRLGAGGIAFHGQAPAVDPARPATDAPTRHPRPAAARAAAEQERRLAHLREANEKLVLAAVSTQELQAAAEASQRRQAAFLAAVADELRDPVAPIRIATEMLGRRPTDAPLLPRVQQLVEARMAPLSRLIGHLVDASKADAGQLELARDRVELGPVVDRAVAACRPLLDERGQHLALQCPPGPLVVLGDAERLEHVVVNLLDHASEHTPDRGRIALDLVAEGDTLRLTVTDDGIGIEPDLLAHVFDPFVQDPRVLGIGRAGVGIGLTVARAVAQAHGGQLLAHSDGSDRGSRFVLTLPRAADAGPGVAGPAAGAGLDESR